MDLPTCPACKQSVLDEDAVDCPFCGAPMKGGSAPARPAPAGKSPTGNATGAKSAPDKPASAKGGAGPAAAAKSATGSARPGKVVDQTPAPSADDDPFGIDPTAAANAIPVSRQQGAGKTIEVTCPMCETKGFISPKASGKQVKCCNPQCMVPLFTAPALEKKEVVAPPKPPKKKIPWLYVGGGIAFAAIAGVSIYFMQDHGPQGFDAPEDIANKYKPPSNSNPLAIGNDGTQPDKQPDVKSNVVQTPAAARDAVVKQALARMVEVSSNIPAQRRPMWRRLAVTAYLDADDPKKAREQLDLLEKGTNQSPWEAIPPLVHLAWRNVNSPEEFKKSVEEATALAEKLPNRGRVATEAAVALAPLLAISGKADAARPLLAKHRSEAPLEQLSAAVRVVIQNQSFDLDKPLPGRSLGHWQSPLETAVTLVLAGRGRWDEAQAWASQLGDPVAKSESTIVWAECLLRDTVPVGDANGLARAVAAGKEFPAEGQARLLARLADVRFAQGDRAGAAELIKQAQEAINSLPGAKPVVVEGIKPLLDLKLEDPIALKQMAYAAVELAGAQAHSGDARAWSNVERSLQFLSAIGPAITPTQERRRQVDSDSNRVSTELKRAMALKKDDETRRALAQYKQKLRDVEAAAATRFQAEVVVLQAAVNFGLLDKVWDQLEADDRKGTTKDHQPLIASHVSLLLVHRYAEAGNNQKSEEISSAIESRIDPADPEVVKLLVEREFQSGKIQACIDQLNAAITPNGHLHELVLRLACRLVVSGKIGEAVTFCNRIHDPSLREEGLYLTAALAARHGKGIEFWKFVKDQNLGALESSAAAAGMIVGFKIEAAK